MAMLYFFYPMLPFCLMNPKGEKNSLTQVMIVEEYLMYVVDVVQVLNLQRGSTILKFVKFCFTSNNFLCIY